MPAFIFESVFSNPFCFVKWVSVGPILALVPVGLAPPWFLSPTLLRKPCKLWKSAAVFGDDFTSFEKSATIESIASSSSSSSSSSKLFRVNRWPVFILLPSRSAFRNPLSSFFLTSSAFSIGISSKPVKVTRGLPFFGEGRSDAAWFCSSFATVSRRMISRPSSASLSSILLASFAEFALACDGRFEASASGRSSRSRALEPLRLICDDSRRAMPADEDVVAGSSSRPLSASVPSTIAMKSSASKEPLISSDSSKYAGSGSSSSSPNPDSLSA
mmetsp:Transcript_33132/g.60439  ORF Transcript_33132/g.60439 Transcript_33132/m.60439 type:complete len:273 (+) Transcript_33132:579-1397(+)